MAAATALDGWRRQVKPDNRDEQISRHHRPRRRVAVMYCSPSLPSR